VTRRLCIALCLALIGASTVADARIHRSAEARMQFKRSHPCPATGERRGACPGYIIDHIEPLCAGGHDHPSNMQWQTTADAKAKDVIELRHCRALKHRT
jgi:hypothetical protein